MEDEVATAGARLQAATAALAEARQAAREVAARAVADGMSEVRVAAGLGVTRRTVRLWLGKSS